MNALRNTWTLLCEALGPGSAPSLRAAAEPIWISGIEFSGGLNTGNEGRDSDSTEVVSVGEPDASSTPTVNPPDTATTTTTTTVPQGPSDDEDEDDENEDELKTEPTATTTTTQRLPIDKVCITQHTTHNTHRF